MRRTGRVGESGSGSGSGRCFLGIFSFFVPNRLPNHFTNRFLNRFRDQFGSVQFMFENPKIV